MKRLVLTVLLLAFGACLRARELPVKLSGGVLLNSAYLWRGEKVCGLNWQPELGVKAGNFELLFYGYLPFDKTYKELDLELVCHIGEVSLHLGDYYFHVQGSGHVDRYFDWSSETGGHVLECALCYVPKELPFYAKWMTFVYGRYLPDGTPAASSYLELEGHYYLGNVCKLAAETGFSIRKDAYTRFTEDFAFIHLAAKASRDFNLGGLTLPVCATYLFNPYYKTSFFSLSAGVRF